MTHLTPGDAIQVNVMASKYYNLNCLVSRDNVSQVNKPALLRTEKLFLLFSLFLFISPLNLMIVLIDIFPSGDRSQLICDT